jgi:hypothetical protein
VLRVLAAVSPFVAILALFATLRPVPAAVGASDRSLILVNDPSAAARYPGRAALDVAGLAARVRFE